MKLELDRVYSIRLCSGELRQWRFEGRDARDFAWWRDVETGASFSETGLMYAWEIVPEGDERG
ncbi:MAG TPA: hypothetical protein PKW99_02765 [Thauera sp.]|jgi:hypothetical protein|nr:hypothetical protein [Thauera sp.]